MDVVVGRVVKEHGIRGEVAVQPHTDSPELRFAAGVMLTGRARDGATTRLTVESSRPHGERLLVRFDGITDRDAAAGLRGYTLRLDSSELAETDDPDEFHDHQLIQLHGELSDGTTVGTVTDVVHGPAGELLVLDTGGGNTVLVPFVRQIVTAVELDRGRLVIDPPEGLLDVE